MQAVNQQNESPQATRHFGYVSLLNPQEGQAQTADKDLSFGVDKLTMSCHCNCGCNCYVVPG